VFDEPARQAISVHVECQFAAGHPLRCRLEIGNLDEFSHCESDHVITAFLPGDLATRRSPQSEHARRAGIFADTSGPTEERDEGVQSVAELEPGADTLDDPT